MRARTGIDPWFLRELRALAPRARGAVRGPAHVPRRGHLRRRVRGRDAVLLLGLGAPRRRRTRSARRPPERDDPRLGPQPHRPGHRVRLLLRARRDDRPRVRPRRRDGQLQPRDGLDGLRHVRPAVLRAAHARGRARDRRGRAARGRDRPVRRPDAAQARRRAARRRACRCSARSVEAIDLAEDRWRFGALLDAARAARRRRTPRRTRRTRRSPRAPARRLPAARAPELRARRPRDGARVLRRGAARTTSSGVRPRGRRSSSTASSRTRSRSTSTRSATARTSGSAGSCSTSRRPGSTPATRPACCRRTRSAARCSTEIRAATARHRARARRGRADQRPVRADRRRRLRHRGQPARLAHRPVRVQGDRHAAGQDGLPGDARRAARRPRPARRPVRAGTCRSRRRCCPFDRFHGVRRAARPRDALDGRGDGRRPRLPDRVRQGAGGGRRAAARDGHRLPHRHRRRQGRARSASPRSCTTSASRSSATARHRAAIARMGDPGRAHQQDRRGLAARRRLDRARRGRPRDQHADGHRARARTATRSAARRSPAASPCITTISGGMAAARAIAAARGGASRRWSRCRRSTRTRPRRTARCR